MNDREDKCTRWNSHIMPDLNDCVHFGGHSERVRQRRGEKRQGGRRGSEQSWPADGLSRISPQRVTLRNMHCSGYRPQLLCRTDHTLRNLAPIFHCTRVRSPPTALQQALKTSLSFSSRSTYVCTTRTRSLQWVEKRNSWTGCSWRYRRPSKVSAHSSADHKKGSRESWGQDIRIPRDRAKPISN